MRRIIVSLGFLILAAGCEDPQPRISDEVMEIPLNLEVDRFDLAFDRMQPSGLSAMKKKYPYLFPEQFADSVWLAKQADTLQQHLRREVRKAFPDFGIYQTELELFFKHAKYYFPNTPVPRVLTLTTDVDYENRVILTDTLLLLGLDNYLGPDHEFYGSLQRYIAQELDPALLVSDVGSAFAQKVVPLPRDRSFIAQMVYYGKALYLKDRLMPLAADSVKIGYTARQLEWAKENESQIWRYFVERELLYSTDKGLGPRFLDPAPFSKFRLMLDNESPGRIGRYVGWQIVRSFMDTNNTSLQEMLRVPGEELFKRSKYKPPK
jgi:gliding motility-associated lipoprotein GldB